MLNIESGERNSTCSYSAKMSRQNRCVLRCDLNVPILPELRMASGSPFQAVGTAEEKQHAAVLVRDLVLSASLSHQISVHGLARMALMWRSDSLID